jgi:hypothetical protein
MNDQQRNNHGNQQPLYKNYQVDVQRDVGWLDRRAKNFSALPPENEKGPNLFRSEPFFNF